MPTPLRMDTLEPGTTGRYRDTVQVLASDDEGDSCPYRFVRGLLTALGLVAVLWLAVAAVVVLSSG